MMAGVKKSRPNCTNPSQTLSTSYPLIFHRSKQSHGKAPSQASREYILPTVVEQDREWMFLNANLIGHNLLGTVSSLSSKIRHKGESIPISKRTWPRTRNQMSFWTFLKMFSSSSLFLLFLIHHEFIPPFSKVTGLLKQWQLYCILSFTHLFMSIEWLLYAKHHAER